MPAWCLDKGRHMNGLNSGRVMEEFRATAMARGPCRHVVVGWRSLPVSSFSFNSTEKR